MLPLAQQLWLRNRYLPLALVVHPQLIKLQDLVRMQQAVVQELELPNLAGDLYLPM